MAAEHSSAHQRGKVFGIGCPKTGTTSLGRCFRILGLRNASWNEDLFMRALAGDNEPALRFAADYESFDDLPWCLLYPELDRRFPGSKFILTVRVNSAAWLKSFRAHHARELGQLLDGEGRARSACTIPVWPDGVHGYDRHNDAARAYFRNRPQDLLEICWERGDGWKAICEFLQMPVPDVPIPHDNRADPRETRAAEAVLSAEERLPAGLRRMAQRVHRPLVRLLRHAVPRERKGD